MNIVTSKRTSTVAVGVLIAALVAAPFAIQSFAHAASLQRAFVRFDRMKTSTATTGTVCAQPATVATEASVQVVFPASYTLGLAATFTVDTTNTAWPSGASAWPGINTATNVTSQTVTFPSTDLTVGTLYCFNWTNSAAVQVKAAATANNNGTITTRDSGPATIDTASYATASITDDQIVVSATVPASFSFALSGNTDDLGTLSTSSVSTSSPARTATVNTNAKNGWLVWARSANTGLFSATNSKTIAAASPAGNATLSAGTESYNTGVTSSVGGGSGTVTVAAPYVGTALGQGAGLDSSLRTIASSNGTNSNAVLTIKNNASIDALTPAGNDYTDTITIVGAGLF